jgi:Ca2+-binding EF-hand superfamily protein
LTGKNYFDFERFLELMKGWGFASELKDIEALYNWLDADQDGKISFHDIRKTVGQEVAPMEQYFFRQDLKPGKNQPCNYAGCWENVMFSRSPYCQLHQKILKNKTVDLFNAVRIKSD